MFITTDVDIPDELVTGPEDGLVIFVGAGVSMGDPSNLPDFYALTRLVATHFGKSIDEATEAKIKSQPDQYLGALALEGLPVNDVVKDLIGKSDSKPNRTHRSLVRLFKTSSQLRIVTTNYDPHLVSAAREEFGDVTVFQAPALPMGNDFSGIVHLHGSIDQEARRLIVTDGDFGRAYLTDAWAARFLHDMYRRYTILYVGYSHSDWMMRYLARGLPADAAPRYALIPEQGDRAKTISAWAGLGIKLVTYPVINDDHGALTKMLEEWTGQSRLGLLEHRARFQEILSRGIAIDRAQLAYIRRFLFDETLSPSFCEFARGEYWLNWLLDLPEFLKLFSPSSRPMPFAVPLARWFAEQFVATDTDVGVAVISRIRQNLSIELWMAIAQVLRLKSFPTGAQRNKWVVLLLATAEDKPQAAEYLGWVLSACIWPDDKNSILVLLDYLLEPTLNLCEPSLGATVGDITLRGNEYVVNSVWTRLVVPHLEECGDKLVLILLHHLDTAARLTRMLEDTHGNWDRLNFRRSAIEEHSQDLHAESLDSLIDLSRDVLAYLVRERPYVVLGYLEFLSQSESALLRRVAAHIWAVREDVSPDDKMNWLIDGRWIFDQPLKHEVYQLIKSAMPNATIGVKRKLLTSAVVRVLPGNDLDGSQTYEFYNLLVWIQIIDPEFVDVIALLQQLEATHGFIPREHPDFDHWMSIGSVEIERPISIEELLAYSPNAALNWLSRKKDEPDDHYLSNYSRAKEVLREGVVENPEWSLGLVKFLSSNEKWNDDSWEPIIRGWAMTNLAPDILSEILTIVAQHQELQIFRDVVSALLEKALIGDLSPEVLVKIRELCKTLWRVNDNITEEETSEVSNQDWLGRAINQWSGKLALAWLRQMSHQRTISAELWAGIDEENSDMLIKMLVGDRKRNDFARSVIASQLHFLNSLDREWTRTNLLPLFDWDNDSQLAEQAWDGFLTWGQHDQSLLLDLLPQYLKSFSHFTQETRRDRLCEHLAWISLYGSETAPSPGGWLDNFISTIDEKTRQSWADYIGHYLSRGGASFADSNWDRWIGQYWKRRLESAPLPIAMLEGNEMLEWTILFGERRDEAILFMLMTPVSLGQAWIPNDFFALELIQTRPEIMTKLFLHFLPTVMSNWSYKEPELRAAVELLKSSGMVTSEMLQKMCTEAIRLGCSDAGGWLN